MKQKIQAGLITDVTNAIKTISDTFFKFIDKFSDYGIEITKEEKLEDGGVKLWCKYNGKDFGIIITPVLDDEGSKIGKVNLQVHYNNKDTKLENINEFDIEKKTKEILNKLLGIDMDNTSANSAKRLQVKLQKITSSDNISINLTAINADYDAELAVNDLNTLLDNDDFIESISDKPCCYEITDTGDEFDISTIDGFDATDSCASIIGAAMKIWCNLAVIHWAAKGENFNDLYNACDNFRWRLMQEIDFFGELSVELSDKAANPGLYTSMDIISPITDDEEGFTAEFGYESIRSMIEQYLSVLDIYYVNFPRDVQSYIDDEIRGWKHDINYILKQRLK